MYVKYFLFSAVVVINVWGFHISMATETLLRLNMVFAVVPFLIIIILKNDLLNLLILWFVLVLFQEIGKISMPVLPDIFPHRIIFVLMVSLYCIEVVLKKRKIHAFSSVEVAMMLFCVYCIFNMFYFRRFSSTEGIGLGNLLSSFVFPFSIFFIAKNVVDDKDKLIKISICFIIIGLYLGITGIFEYLKMDQFVFPKYILHPFKGAQIGRGARGPFLNAAVDAVVIGVIICITVYLYYYELKGRKRLFAGISLIPMFITLIVTFNRACWLGTFLALFFMSIFLTKVRKPFLMGISLILLFVMLNYSAGKMNIGKQRGFTDDMSFSDKVSLRLSSVDTIYGRLDLLEVTLRMFLDRPFFGFGFNSFKESAPEYFLRIERFDHFNVPTNHNTFGGVLVDLGLAGFAIYIYILLVIFSRSLKLYLILPEEGLIGKKLVIIFWAAIIIYFIKMNTSELRYFLFPNAMIFMLSGVIMGIYQRLSNEMPESHVPGQETLLSNKTYTEDNGRGTFY